MARVSNEISVRDAVGLSSEAQKAFEQADWFISDAGSDFLYKAGENGSQVRTDQIVGATVLLSGPRTKTTPDFVKNKELKVKVDDAWNENDCQNAIGQTVRLKVKKATVYGNSQKDSTYVDIRLSLHVKLLTENGDVFDPRRVN